MTRSIERIEKIEERDGIAFITLTGRLLYITLPSTVEGYARCGRWELTTGDILKVTANSEGIVDKVHQVVFQSEEIADVLLQAHLRRN